MLAQYDNVIPFGKKTLMMEVENIVLSWDSFETSVANTFRELWKDQEFADVTLVTVDDQQFRVHKTVLISCSSFFKKILSKNPHPAPLIYLKGIRHKELEMVVKFIYLGQCDIAYDEISEFLATGTDLLINGLVEGFSQTNRADGNSKPKIEIEDGDETKEIGMTDKFNIKKWVIPKFENGFISAENEMQNHPSIYTTIPGNATTNKMSVIKENNFEYICKKCGYKAYNNNELTDHTQSTHGSFKYECDNCMFRANDINSLTHHKEVKHKLMIVKSEAKPNPKAQIKAPKIYASLSSSAAQIYQQSLENSKRK